MGDMEAGVKCMNRVRIELENEKNKYASFNQRLDEMDERTKQIPVTRDQLINKMHGMDSRIGDIVSRTTQLTESHGTLSTKMDAMDSRIGSLDGNTMELHKSHGELTGLVVSRKETDEKTSDTLRDLARDVKGMGSTMKQLTINPKQVGASSMAKMAQPANRTYPVPQTPVDRQGRLITPSTSQPSTGTEWSFQSGGASIFDGASQRDGEQWIPKPRDANLVSPTSGRNTKAAMSPRKRARTEAGVKVLSEADFASVNSVLAENSSGAAEKDQPAMSAFQQRRFEDWDEMTSSIVDILGLLRPLPDDPYPINNLMHELLQALDHGEQAEGIQTLSTVLEEDSDVSRSGQWICVSQLCGTGNVVPVDPKECQYCKLRRKDLCFRICLYPNDSKSYVRLLRLNRQPII
ncbi:hypothetical protein PG993_010651 [Apiospora rasikravindrae]|uniref:Uncharacterized protein n=1 Tax=Apiospora rasikravindrae TaxID=990691 RepID=A0ABR1SMU3_9PEZI